MLPPEIYAAPVAIEQLKQLPYFNRLPDALLAKLQPHVSERLTGPGDLVLRCGDYSDAAFFIAEGAVDIQVPQAAGGAPGDAGAAFTRVRLDAGEIFGEIGALSRYPVTADVVSVGTTRLVAIGTPALRLLMKQRDLADFKAFVDNRYRTRAMASHLRGLPLLEGLDDAAIARLCERAELLSFDPGEHIVDQGSRDEALYLLRGGHVRVSHQVAPGAEDLAVSCLSRGECIGEQAVIAGEPWPVSLQAIEHVEMVRVTRGEVDAVAASHPVVTARLREAAAARQRWLGEAVAAPGALAHLQMAMDRGLVNGQSILLIDMNTCTGCDDCVRACADTHQGVPRFVRQGSVHSHWTIVDACYQCSEPVCMVGCPTGAITRPHGGIAVAINDDTCIGCSNCANRCPWHQIFQAPQGSLPAATAHGIAVKCDLCIGRAEGPACVQMCPHGSAVRVSFQQQDDVARAFTGAAR